MNHPAENDQWLVWQLVDSAFPTGGFAHSGGLESAWQHGEVRDAAALASFLESSLWQLACGMIPFVASAHGNPEKARDWDDCCDAFLSNHVANRASRSQGQAFLRSTSRIFGPTAGVGADFEYYHLAPVFGVLTRALSLQRTTVTELFAFQSLRGWMAAAIRLGIVGPMEGQGLQYRLASRAREILLLTKGREPSQAVSVAPLLEIWQGSQDRLYSRLFQS